MDSLFQGLADLGALGATIAVAAMIVFGMVAIYTLPYLLPFGFLFEDAPEETSQGDKVEGEDT
jgi:hypothetical protein